jgi:O-succinylbenzoate synthase
VKISACVVYAYSLPLTTPFRVADRVLDRREGWLLHLTDHDGHMGWGDIAPLPGFSHESPALARQQLLLLADRLSGMEVDPLAVLRNQHPSLQGCCSSVRFGAESGLLQLAAHQVGQPLATQLGAGGPSSICPINALVAGPLATCEAEACLAVKEGYPAIKLKVGRDTTAHDIERIQRVAGLLPEAVALRLDANRAWSLEQAQEVALGLAGVKLDYVEEPLADPGQLSMLHDATGWPLALDESLQAEPSALRGVVAWVIKPTLMGGLVAGLTWMERARSLGLRAVLSSAFESGVGIRVVAEMAALQPGVPVGLDTYRRLGSDVLEPRLKMSGGCIHLADARSSSVTLTRLVKQS